MLTVINKQDQTQNIPHESIQIDSVVGDPLGKAKFTLYDNNSSIALQCLQEVIIFDETVAITPSTTMPAALSFSYLSPFSDNFAINDSSNYTSTNAPSGSTSTWTFNTGNITVSGGSSALLLLNNWTAQNCTVTATMTQSDIAGLAFNVVNASNYYELSVRDASSPIPNSLQLFKTVNGTRYTIGPSNPSISFTRGTSHTISVSSVNSGGSILITATFDGSQIFTYTDTTAPLLGSGQVGLRNDTFSGVSSGIYTSFSATSNDNISSYTSTYNPLGNPATWTFTPSDSNHALSTYLTHAISATLSTSEQLYSTSGTPTTTNTSTKCDTSTGLGELVSQGSTSAWTALGAIGSPSGNGFLLDATTLEGKTIAAGNWTGNVRIKATSSGTVTADLTVRIYKYSGGTYTNIVTFTLPSQSWTSTASTVALSSTAGVSMAFSTGDKLYIDYWANITANTSSTGQAIQFGNLSTDTVGNTGSTTTQIVSPGYSTTNEGTIIATGGLSSLLLLNNWMAQNCIVTTTMTQSDHGGIAFNVIDTSNYYELEVCDASSLPVYYDVRGLGSTLIYGANTLQLYKTVSGIRTKLGSWVSISFLRGTSHTVSVTSTHNGTSTLITVTFDGTSLISYTDPSPLTGRGQVGLRNDTVGVASTSTYTTFSTISNDGPFFTTSIPSHNYITNNNFNFGNAGYNIAGTLSSRMTFPSNPTFGNGAKATLTFSNNAVGSVTIAQTDNYPQVKLIFPGQTYCFSLFLNITASFVNSSCFIGITWYDIDDNSLSTVQQNYTANTNGATRVSITATAPSNAYDYVVFFGGSTSSTTNSGSATFTALQFEPAWFPNMYTYPTPICDFLQSDCVTLPDGTTSRFDRIMTGFITHLTASYVGPVRTWDVEVTAADLLLETSTLINANYTSITDANIIRGIVNNLPNTPLFAATPSLQTNTPAALAYRNVPICYTGATFSTLQFADASIREVLNTITDSTGFMYGVDAYYNVYYYPPFYTQCPYAFSSSPDNTNSFPYYDYSIIYDGTQLHNAVRVVGATFTTTVTESWHFQDGSHTETLQGGKVVSVTLFHLPNAIPSNITVGGTSISCAEDTGVGYGTAQSLLSLTTFGTPQLLSFLAPGYASGTSISVTYAYDTLAYTALQSPDSIAQYGMPYYFKINDTNLDSISSCVIRGEAELEEYSQPRVTLKFKVNQLVNVGQVVVFTSVLDNIINGHYTVQKVTGTYLGNKTNQYDIEAGTYVDNFIDFFRNTQKAVNTLLHDPSAPIQQINNLQQDTISFSDSLNIHF